MSLCLNTLTTTTIVLNDQNQYQNQNNSSHKNKTKSNKCSSTTMIFLMDTSDATIATTRSLYQRIISWQNNIAILNTIGISNADAERVTTVSRLVKHSGSINWENTISNQSDDMANRIFLSDNLPEDVFIPYDPGGDPDVIYLIAADLLDHDKFSRVSLQATVEGIIFNTCSGTTKFLLWNGFKPIWYLSSWRIPTIIPYDLRGDHDLLMPIVDRNYVKRNQFNTLDATSPLTLPSSGTPKLFLKNGFEPGFLWRIPVLRCLPYVGLNWYYCPRNSITIVHGMKKIREVLRRRSLEEFLFQEWFLGTKLPLNQSNNRSMEDFCRRRVSTIWHYHGGCIVEKVGESDHRVTGVDNLRIVDGSILSVSPGTDPQATVMMMGRNVKRHRGMPRGREEVILCADAIGSRQLLLLSATGPHSYLSSWGIPVVQHLPYVGQYLYDNPRNGITSVPPVPLDSLIQVVGIIDAGTYIKDARKIGKWLREGLLEKSKFQVWFEAREVRFVATTLPLNQSDDRSMEDICRRTVSTIWPCHGGCIVGKVVESDYRVTGVDNLRIVDGSILSVSPGTDPQATVMMMGRNVKRHHGMPRGREEVILCADAIGSRQLLLLSATGPHSYLSSWGIPVVQHLPYVGQYLYDNPRNGITSVPPVPLDSLIQVVGIIDAGIYIEDARKIGKWLREGLLEKSKFQVWFEAREFRFAATTLPLNHSDDRSMEDICRRTVSTIWPCHGGCIVGKVVESDHRVTGVDNLRIVDGSILSVSPGTDPQATVMMMGRYVGIRKAEERRRSVHRWCHIMVQIQV